MAGLKKKNLAIYQSFTNGNYFVKLNNKLIAGFKNKEDAELFVEAKKLYIK